MNKVLSVLNYLSQSVLVDQSISAGGGYRVYSDGWKEQWGLVTSVAYSNNTINVTFLKPFVYEPQVVMATPRMGSGSDGSYNISGRVANVSTTGMTVRTGKNNDASGGHPTQWYAAGF